MNNIITQIENNHWLMLITILIMSWAIFLATKTIIIRSLRTLFKRTTTQLDDILIEQKFISRLAYYIPFIILHNFSSSFVHYEILASRLTMGAIIIVSVLVINSFLNSINSIYKQTKYASRMDIKSYVQILKLIITVLGGLTAVAIISGKSPTLLLSGIGALTAVLMLVFKDTILSFVASIQINSNDLFKIGDWIEAPQFGADGDVIDIALHSVKIQNWDKTISVIPTHKLVDSSFKNWRGMSESGGRRIKRALYIDQSSIQFCTPELLEKFRSFELLSSYLQSKIQEVDTSNNDKGVNMDQLVNGRRLTNIGTFRAYIKAFLQNHPNIHNDMTLLIRQLQPSEKGLPIEIYVFTNTTDWNEYEAIQADIFDHLLAVIPEFGLSLFQNPTGKDFKKIVS